MATALQATPRTSRDQPASTGGTIRETRLLAIAPSAERRTTLVRGGRRYRVSLREGLGEVDYLHLAPDELSSGD